MSLAGLRPAFKKDGSVTAGNASGINDGAAALVLMSAEAAARQNRISPSPDHGLCPCGRRSLDHGIGPIPAVQKLLAKLNLKASDFDVVESNEAFAAQACAVSKGLGLSAEQTNPNGGAIALGHPVTARAARSSS